MPSIGRYLFLWAEAYAQRELVRELSDTPNDTSALDKGMRNGGLPTAVGKTTFIFYTDRSFFIDTLDEKLLQQMEQMKKEAKQ